MTCKSELDIAFLVFLAIFYKFIRLPCRKRFFARVNCYWLVTIYIFIVLNYYWFVTLILQYGHFFIIMVNSHVNVRLSIINGSDLVLKCLYGIRVIQKRKNIKEQYLQRINILIFFHFWIYIENIFHFQNYICKWRPCKLFYFRKKTNYHEIKWEKCPTLHMKQVYLDGFSLLFCPWFSSFFANDLSFCMLVVVACQGVLLPKKDYINNLPCLELYILIRSNISYPCLFWLISN